MQQSFTAPHRPSPIFGSISEFALGKVLGSGAFASVSEAVHRSSGVRYAVKEIKLRNLSVLDQENVEKELEIHSRLSCEHLIKLYDFLVEGNSVYLVLEYASRGNLFRHMNRKKISESEIRKLFVQTALALDYLHSQGVIMRDLKPENLLLDNNMNIKLCDLGWAARLDDVDYCTVKAGTYAYMSPESLRGQRQTEKTDIWSLGILLYELSYNKEPYNGQSCSEQLGKILNTVLDFRSPINLDAQNLILALLKENGADRLSMDDIFRSSYVQSYSKRNLVARPWRLSKNENQQWLNKMSPSRFGTSLSEANKLNTNMKQPYQAEYKQMTSIQQSLAQKDQITNHFSANLSLARDFEYEQASKTLLTKMDSIDSATNKVSNNQIQTSQPSAQNRPSNGPVLYKPRIFDTPFHKNSNAKFNTQLSKKEDEFAMNYFNVDEKIKPPMKLSHSKTPDISFKTYSTLNQSQNSQINFPQTSHFGSSKSPVMNSKYRNFEPQPIATRGVVSINFASNTHVSNSRITSSRLTAQESGISVLDHKDNTSTSNIDAKSFTQQLCRKARRMDTDSTIGRGETGISGRDISNDDSRSVSPNLLFPTRDNSSPFLSSLMKIVPSSPILEPTLNPRMDNYIYQRPEVVNARMRDESVNRKVVLFPQGQGLSSERPVSVDNRMGSHQNVHNFQSSTLVGFKQRTNTMGSSKNLHGVSLERDFNIYTGAANSQTRITDLRLGGKDGMLMNIYSNQSQKESGTIRSKPLIKIDLNN